MQHKDALSILGLQAGVSFDDIKTAYRKACAAYHPDRNPAGLEMMKLVNQAYEALSDYNGEQFGGEEVNVDFGDKMNAALNLLVSLGLELELCGTWLWVHGDSYPHRAVLKEHGFRWAPVKKLWYFRPADYKSFGRGKMSIDEIRERHGSQKIAGNANKRLNVA